MSDKPEGPGWWIASDGNWYPPELHPSVRDDVSDDPGREPAQVTGNTQPRRWQGHNDHVGPQFPDLFKKAMEGSHLADNVSVKYDGDDRVEDQTSPGRGPAGSATNGGGTPVAAGVAGATIGAPAKRKWRKGH